MTSSRPYLVRALYEWIVVNDLSPYLLVDAKIRGVQAPAEFSVNQKIVFNLSPQAVKDLNLGNESITFSARFSGKPQNIVIPISAVLAIYSKENGRGMVFSEDDETQPPDPSNTDKSKTKLKLVK
ncbi:MAG: ClpXP protease specificity-enhancing factor [Gammaproteobacteria bacterium]|nr:ClpXP protease specificity-enhancing factor [Gammaproteobacteria bacterium]